MGRKAPQRHNHARLQQLNLAQQIRRTLLHLLPLRVAVHGWAALDHIGDKHLPLALQAHGGQHAVKQLPRTAHKRLALNVFFFARRFTHEQPVGPLCIARTGHHLSAALAQLALLAAHQGVL